MKNVQNKKKQISKNKENKNPNKGENKIKEIKIKIEKKNDIKKIYLPARKKNIIINKKPYMNNNTYLLSENNNEISNNNLVNKNLIFLKKKNNSINDNKPKYNFKTERNHLKSLQKKKKLLKISTNDELFNIYKNKLDKYIQRPNKMNLTQNSTDPLTKTFSFNKEKSLDNDEKSLEFIEKFADKFKNKERSESLKNVLNMYKRYKSLSSMTNKNKFNNTYSSIHIIKNKSYYQKKENAILNEIKRNVYNQKLLNKINSIPNSFNSNYIYENKENINNINTKKEKNEHQENKKDRKYFLRKVVREEKCYMDKNGKIHVVDYKQSLIYDKNKNKLNSKKKEKNKTTQKNIKNKKQKKINVEINQINNINSYNNISDINSINNLKKNKKNINNMFDNVGYHNITERNEADNICMIDLPKKINKNNPNLKYYENKIKFIPKKLDENILNNNNISFDRITHRTVHSLGQNYSYQFSYNNHSMYNDKIIDFKKYYNGNRQNQYNNFGYNNTNINEYNYKNNYDLYYNNSNIFAQNNNNCSYYESKSLSNYKDKFLKDNNSRIEFFRNNIFDENYTNNSCNDNDYFNDNLNNKTFFNSYYIEYPETNTYNNRQSTRKINSYRLIRIPKNKN